MSDGNGKVKGPGPTVIIEIVANLGNGDMRVSGPNDLLLTARILTAALRSTTDRMAAAVEQVQKRMAGGIQVAGAGALRLLKDPEPPKGAPE
ncbi:MAG: hypothetical protein MUC63_10445 [Planctomycetes bacterium]|nr:hypothetical protein [Planctomycetota bacterium]